MANIPGSVRLTGFIAPTDSTDVFPVTDPKWGLGGLRRVSGATERDSISTGRRESGMLVYSENDDTYYKLDSGLTNSDWSIFVDGGGSGDFLALSGGTVTGVTEFTAGLIANSFSGGTINLTNTPSNDNALTQILARDGSTGTIKYRDASTFGSAGNFLALSGGTVTGDTIFTQSVSADTMNLTSTTEAQFIITPVNIASPADGSMWFTTSGGTTYLNYQVTGATKSVELT
jgi:hypothetical protein